MSSVVQAEAGFERTDAPFMFRTAVVLGGFQAVMVLLFSLVSRFLDGPVELALEAILVLIGAVAVIVLPGLWTRARSVEGIAGAAMIGLGATAVFLVIDVALLQPIGTYTFRWRAIGGGSNWWYHPVWWMVGTFLAWMGAWILANQTARRGAPSVPVLVVLLLIGTLVAAAAGILLHLPGAGLNLGTFGVAIIPGLALATLASALGSRRD